MEMGAWEIYRKRFESTAGQSRASVSPALVGTLTTFAAALSSLRPPAFFSPRFSEATKVGGEMIKVISAQSAKLASESAESAS